MSAHNHSNSSAALPNGPGAAALLAAGIGSLVLAILAMTADKIPALGKSMIFWKPTGPLSGVTTCAIVVWLAAWFVLDRSWARRNVALSKVSTVAIVLLLLGLLLTFPPLADLL